MSVERLIAEVPMEAAKLATNAVKDIWSVMDAAAEKPAPSQYLGAKAMSAIQGVTDQTQKVIRAAQGAS